MPTDTKNSTENASRSGSDSSAARWLSADSRITMPAKNAPSANDTPNSAADAVGDAHRRRDHAQRKQLARAGARHLPQHPRNEPPPDARASTPRTPPPCRASTATRQDRARRFHFGRRPLPPSHTPKRRQQHQHQDHHEVFHHEPADGDAAVQRLEHAAALERAQQHHGARNGQRQTEHERGAEAPAPQRRDAGRRAP